MIIVSTFLMLVLDLAAGLCRIPQSECSQSSGSAACSAMRLDNTSEPRPTTPDLIKKQSDGGGVRTWTGLDADTKLCVSYLVGVCDLGWAKRVHGGTKHIWRLYMVP